MNRAQLMTVAAWITAGCLVAGGCGSSDDSPPAPTATSSPTQTPTLPPTATQTATLTATATATRTPTATPTSSNTATSTPTTTPTATATTTPSPTNTRTPSVTATVTPTKKPTQTPTPTIECPPKQTFAAPLGTRHFVLDSSKSIFQVRIAGGLTIPLGSFQGQTNGQIGQPAFLDLEAEQPDANGFALLNITKASDYIYVDATQMAGFIFCIKPLVPVKAAGLIGCNGGADVSISLDEDHHVGQVGVNGFTAAQCEAQQGHVEVPYAVCSAGTVGQPCNVDADCNTGPMTTDGICTHFPSTCSSGKTGPCQTDADCDPGDGTGTCGMPHGGVCNGPLIPGTGTGDTGCGELVIVPNPNAMPPLNGMPIELGFETALPCGDEGPGMRSPFALTTGLAQSMVTDANNMLGKTLSFKAQGENFDCTDWPNGTRGRLVLSAPALDQRLVGDVSTIFNFASH